MRGGGGCGVSAIEYSFARGAKINFGDLPPFLTYDAEAAGFVNEVKTRAYRLQASCSG